SQARSSSRKLSSEGLRLRSIERLQFPRTEWSFSRAETYYLEGAAKTNQLRMKKPHGVEPEIDPRISAFISGKTFLLHPHLFRLRAQLPQQSVQLIDDRFRLRGFQIELEYAAGRELRSAVL